MPNNQRGPTPVHYLRTNDTCWSPPHVIFFDTETYTIPNTEPEILALRLWAATRIDRRNLKNAQPDTVHTHGETGMELAEWITKQSGGRKTLWAFAHNLSFDLVTTRLPLELATLGWSITDAAVGGRAPWMRLVKDSARLCLVDSGSWLPKPLKEIGDAIGIVKPALPSEMDATRMWLARCKADVNILTTAMLSLMEWWDDEQLGRWDVSGAGTGWHAFRHLPQLQRTVVDPSQDFIRLDRQAIYGGRRGTWVHGKTTGGPLVELDFTAAYPTIAATLPLPVRRGARFESMDLSNWRVTSERWGMVAECVINTEIGNWPLAWGGQKWYPTGRFRTVLASPDIWEAKSTGVLESIGAGQMHQLGYGMQNWASWVLSLQDGTNSHIPPAAVMAAKNWGRAVIGKWAARSFDKIELGASPIAGWGYTEGWDHDSNTRGGMVDIAGQRWWVSSSGESDNAYPAILAYVESYTRVRIGRVIESIGPRCVVQCDTDGLIVKTDRIGQPDSGGTLIAPQGLDSSDRLDWCINELNTRCAPLSIRVKNRVRSATIVGPQHVDGGKLTRHAGIAASAVRTAPNTYVGRTWPKLQWQMSQGDPRGYARPEVTSVIRGVHAPGWVTASGSVVPPRAVISTSGETVILPWGLMPPDVQKLGLAPEQNRRLPS